MRQYFHFFRYFIAAFSIALLFYLAVIGYHALLGNTTPDRNNDECTTTERVFDHADVLSDKEEEKLRKLIAKREKQTGCDIVIVTLNESLKEYARKYDPSAEYSEFTMIYADNFCDEHKFGYNKPQGDGVLLLDNLYRESNGSVYTWMTTTGKAMDKYSSEMISHILDLFYENVDSHPYLAYKTFINQFYHDMTGSVTFTAHIPRYLPALAGAAAAVIFVALNLSGKKGNKTTNAKTYVQGGHPELRRKQDLFLRKSVVKRRIETNSNSGGRGGSGGRHVSSGGVSHGGGGHAR